MDYVSVLQSTRSGVDESGSNFMFNPPWSCQTAFQSSWSVLGFQQRYRRVPISPLPRLTRVITCLIGHSHQVGVKWHLFVGFIFISSWLTMLSIFSLLAIYIPVFEKCLCKSFADFQWDSLTFSH